jgi:hypothetical protein
MLFFGMWVRIVATTPFGSAADDASGADTRRTTKWPRRAAPRLAPSLRKDDARQGASLPAAGDGNGTPESGGLSRPPGAGRGSFEEAAPARA